LPSFLTTSSVLMCPHGGTVTIITSNTQVMAGGDFMVRSSDTFIIAGCPFLIGLVPHPCVQVQWVQPAARSQAAGDFTLTEESMGLCIAVDESVQGMVLITATQEQVAGQ
jgi:hypothetical protein